MISYYDVCGLLRPIRIRMSVNGCSRQLAAEQANRWYEAADDPEPPFGFLQSSRSAKLDLCETECYEAAIGDFTLPARTGSSQLVPKDDTQRSLPKAIQDF